MAVWTSVICLYGSYMSSMQCRKHVMHLAPKLSILLAILSACSAGSSMLKLCMHVQSAIASTPTAAWQGYLLGGIMWFCIPFTLSTGLGLATVACDLPVSVDEANMVSEFCLKSPLQDPVALGECPPNCIIMSDCSQVGVYVAPDGWSSFWFLVCRVWCLSLLPRYDSDLASSRCSSCLSALAHTLLLGQPPGISIWSKCLWSDLGRLLHM